MAKNLSKFVFKQLVYDYLIGELSGEELEKFESKLNAEGDCHDYVELTKESMQYVSELANLKVSSSAIAELKDYKNNNLFYLYNPFSFKVPKIIKLGLPLLALLGVLYLASNFIPFEKGIHWLKSKSEKVTVAETGPHLQESINTNATNIKDVKIEMEAPKAINNFKPGSNQGISPSTEEVIVNTAKVDNKTLDLKKSSDEFVSKIKELPKVPPASVGSEKNNLVVVNNKVGEITKKTEPDKKEVAKKKGPRGVLYRVYMSLRDLEGVTPQIVEIIERMSGEKAGKKKLGYLKPKGRSFHFKLPMNYRDQVFEELKVFGRVKIDKEKHWRIMPEGQSRVILWVEDLDLKAARQRGR